MTEKTKAELEKELEDVRAQVEAEKAKEVPEIQKKEVEVPTVVVREIPQIDTRIGYVNDGKDQVNLLTVEEAITEILTNSRLIKAATVNS